MRYYRTERKRFIFLLERFHKLILVKLLRSYPLLPPGHHQISRNDPLTMKEHQALLEEALAEQREENRKQVVRFLKSGSRFRKQNNLYRLSLSATQLEWLLQVLNDIRVGAWLLLGSPEQLDESPESEPHRTLFFTMYFAGFFQSALIEAGADRQESC